MYTYLAESIAQKFLVFFLMQLRLTIWGICIPFAHSYIINIYIGILSTKQMFVLSVLYLLELACRNTGEQWW